MQPRKLIEFLNIIEKLKCHTRHSWTSTGRQESVAEHSWRLAVMALLVTDEFPQVDISKVVKMCLIHDFGEAITGDVPSFLKTEQDEAREDLATAELLALLPESLACEFCALFTEMSQRNTAESKLFKALDNLEAVVSHNEAPLDTWLPCEYSENLVYGAENTAYSAYLTLLREELKQDSIEKIKAGAQCAPLQEDVHMSLDQSWFDEMEAKIPCGKVRTRFAPSPTGYMHVGNLRTALYTYLIARKENGTFILRIEDTDQSRLVEGAMDVIYKTLADCGLTHDEGPDVGGPVGPYIQTERRDSYGKYAELLLERDGAYRCFCDKSDADAEPADEKAIAKYDGRCGRLSAEEIQAKLDVNTPYVIRQRIPAGKTSFDDLVFGHIEVDNAELDDGVLIKSDGLPTYNFANVIDDHLMGITHVVRGSEYLSSTPKYNLLYQSFGWEPPVYIHCSPVMRDAQHKMSKRHGDPSYEDLIAMGYLTDAILNYVALLGWSPGGEEEMFTLSQLIEAFHVGGISKSPAIFDMDKLRYFSSAYIRAMEPDAFAKLAAPYIRETVQDPRFDVGKIAAILQQRCETLCDIPEKVDFFDVLPEYGTELFVNKKSKTDEMVSKAMLDAAIPALEAITDWNQENIHACLMELAERLEVKNATLMFPVRIAAAGKMVTPGGAIEICAILGKDETLRRLEIGQQKLS